MFDQVKSWILQKKNIFVGRGLLSPSPLPLIESLAGYAGLHLGYNIIDILLRDQIVIEIQLIFGYVSHDQCQMTTEGGETNNLYIAGGGYSSSVDDWSYWFG